MFCCLIGSTELQRELLNPGSSCLTGELAERQYSTPPPSDGNLDAEYDLGGNLIFSELETMERQRTRTTDDGV